MSVHKSKNEIPTIDAALVTIVTKEGETDEYEFGFDTSTQVSVEPAIEEEDAIKLIVKGILRAQKPKTSTLTGNTITLSDNVFNPELVKVLQGGTIVYDTTDTSKIISYTPPVAGSSDKGEVFKTKVYSAIYGADGVIKGYEVITYPNCKGNPVAFSSEDNVFRAPEYVIDSAPDVGEAPYKVEYVDELPTLVTNSNGQRVYSFKPTAETDLGKTKPEAEADDSEG